MGHAAQPLGDALTGRVRQRSFASSARNGLVSNIVLEQLCSAAGIPRRRRSSQERCHRHARPLLVARSATIRATLALVERLFLEVSREAKGRGIGSAASVAFLWNVVSTGRRQSRDLHRGFVPVCPPLARGVQRRP